MFDQYFRVKNIDDSRPSRERGALVDSLELGASSGSIGPVSKIKKLPNSGELPAEVRDFTRAGEELNITRQTIDPPPSLASGISFYAEFCGIAGGHVPLRRPGYGDGELFSTPDLHFRYTSAISPWNVKCRGPIPLPGSIAMPMHRLRGLSMRTTFRADAIILFPVTSGAKLPNGIDLYRIR